MEHTVMGMSADETRLLEIFHPYAYKKMAQAYFSGARFVHYTSADTALRIIQGEEVWMRKSTCMNDFSEIEYGLDCLVQAYNISKERFEAVYDGMFPGISKDLADRFNSWIPIFRNDTYISCISEHDPKEDRIGRLSMWRAYGGSAGVAIVLKGAPLLNPTDALRAYTSPVAYLSREMFVQEFHLFLNGIERNAELVKSLGAETVIARMFDVFRIAMLCNKHPGFAEEQEWRIIYSPRFMASQRIKPDIQSIGGVPQKLYKIPLKNQPEENLTGIEIHEIVDSIIVGPTQFPVEIAEALVEVLTSKGMQDASKKVVISDIPLRN